MRPPRRPGFLGPGGRLGVAVVVALVLGLLGPGGELPLLSAFPGEEAGFQGIPWGTTIPDLFARRPGIAKRGYKLPAALAASKRHAGGIVLDEHAELFGFVDASIRWSLGPGGLFRAEITLTEPDSARYGRKAELLATLTASHGPPTLTEPTRTLWKGEQSVLLLEEQPSISGLRFLVTVVRRADFDQGTP
ncbi:MAG: hypothetical protein RBU45_14050 [Myxococcota bacterium]|nr:hypothetical protein [Myxococcota bacterium]